MNGEKRLHTLFVDTYDKGHGSLKRSFGEKGLWSDEIEQKNRHCRYKNKPLWIRNP
jgi:hypothetical protein